MQQTILVTGGFGFLGHAVALKYKMLGYRVIGMGHSQWTSKQALSFGYDVWFEASVSLKNLKSLDDKIDLIVHCAGNSSVAQSISNPLEDFSQNVLATAELLEFLRITKSEAMLIYPSSASVYGVCEDSQINESVNLNPISPYGYHKKIIEQMLEMYSNIYSIKVAIVRFFSIYGPGLRKQLLWDASTKLLHSKKEVLF